MDARRHTLQEARSGARVGRYVRATDGRELHAVRRGFHARHVDRGELLDMVEDASDVIRERQERLIRELESRKMRDSADLFDFDGHRPRSVITARAPRALALTPVDDPTDGVTVDDLIHRLAHDLRAPLRSVSSAAAWILEDLGRDASEDLKTSVGILESSVQRMERMLEVLLSIARAAPPSSDEPFDAAEELRQIEVEDVELEIQETIRLRGDRHAFEVAARELLVNAALHGEAETARVTVTFEPAGEGAAWIAFLDDGPPVTDYVRDNALRLFYSRFGASDAEHVGGGLSIAAAHAEAHGGALQLGPPRARGLELRMKWKTA